MATAICWQLIGLIGLLCLCFNTEATVTLSPTEARVCRDGTSRVVFTCSTSDPVLVWDIKSRLYRFPDPVTGNSSQVADQYVLEIKNNSSSVITSTATTLNATAPEPTPMEALSCFGSTNETRTESGYFVPTVPPTALDSVNVSGVNSSVTVTWSNASLNLCLDFFEVNITTCSSDVVIVSLKANSNMTTISYTLPDNLSPLDGICAIVTPVDDRGRTPSMTNNKTCSCTKTVTPSSTPTMNTNESGYINLVIGVSIGTAVVAVILVVLVVVMVIAIITKVRKNRQVKKKRSIVPNKNGAQLVQVIPRTDNEARGDETDDEETTARKKVTAKVSREYLNKMDDTADNPDDEETTARKKVTAKVREYLNKMDDTADNPQEFNAAARGACNTLEESIDIQ